jgi:hypothetical protein
MPRRCNAPTLPWLLDAQDHVVHRDQAMAAGLTHAAIRHRLKTGRWSILLPSVYLDHSGAASRRQLLIAALLYAGAGAAIDADDACRFHGIKAVAVDETRVHVVVADGSPARSRGFVIVRRTGGPIHVVDTERLRYVDAATAVIAATRRIKGRRRVLAVMSDALQRRVTTYDELVAAHVQATPRNSRLADEALATLGAGIRSVPEADFRRLVEASATLPAVEFNVWLRLETGEKVCVDALIRSSAVVHETNGRRAHAREDLFEDMQERHDALTANGFVVLHNPPSRIRRRGREVLAQVERCHQLYADRGMPAGVKLLASAV